MNKAEYILTLKTRQIDLITEHAYLRSVTIGRKNPLPALISRRGEVESELLQLADLIDSVINTPAPGE